MLFCNHLNIFIVPNPFSKKIQIQTQTKRLKPFEKYGPWMDVIELVILK